jgi:sugar lactone lactonase YvrE
MGANDMAVDSKGRLYVGNVGYDLTAGEEPTSTALVLVGESGRAGPVTPIELIWPNGIVVDERRRRLLAPRRSRTGSVAMSSPTTEDSRTGGSSRRSARRSPTESAWTRAEGCGSQPW